MKMKQQRKLLKNPPYKHTCHCMMQEFEYLQELPETSHCVNPRFFERDEKNNWIDVTDQVEIIKYY